MAGRAFWEGGMVSRSVAKAGDGRKSRDRTRRVMLRNVLWEESEAGESWLGSKGGLDILSNSVNL